MQIQGDRNKLRTITFPNSTVDERTSLFTYLLREVFIFTPLTKKKKRKNNNNKFRNVRFY